MSAQALHVLHVSQCDDHCYMLHIVLQDAQNDMKTYVLEKTAKETEGTAPPESPSVRRKRKRSAKTKTGIRPRALFQENDDPGAAARASDADESDHPEAGDDNASEASSPAPSIQEDDDIFDGKFKIPTTSPRKTPKRRRRQLSTGKVARKDSMESVLGPTPSKAEEAAADCVQLSRSCEKRLLELLPGEMNPFLGCMSVCESFHLLGSIGCTLGSTTASSSTS